MKRKPVIWLSREDYARCTAEDFANFDIGIDLTGDWYSYEPQKDYENEANRQGISFTQYMWGKR